VTVVGGGVVGTNAAKIALGLGADVSILELSPVRLRQLHDLFGSSVNTIMSNAMNIQEEVSNSDLVIGSVLIPGKKAPVLVTEDMVKDMPQGSVVVDVAIDQGGNFETSDRITSHDDPTFTKHGVVHYTVPNIPGQYHGQERLV
jgi:alanine dehydrogenase